MIELFLSDLSFSPLFPPPHAERPYSRLDAYAQSKLAEVAFCEELEERVPEGRRLRVVSVHPGNVVVGTQPAHPDHFLRADCGHPRSLNCEARSDTFR